ncbi:hypothetical protein GCM10010116_46800 [Microbispora rosea subsp. aerata]|nr:hypothetical protein GCM10010116_46800 [Microbispora rosea subsp. aerata]GIH57730.1 hypothetical protein Mro02_46440 [Microbispora rosea subsp. aerata]GLJ84097.1 hypothetical protein GCM10017588_28250 [Microbispora rosea subsp. aerata]
MVASEVSHQVTVPDTSAGATLVAGADPAASPEELPQAVTAKASAAATAADVRTRLICVALLAQVDLSGT